MGLQFQSLAPEGAVLALAREKVKAAMVSVSWEPLPEGMVECGALEMPVSVGCGEVRGSYNGPGSPV
ncbi:hypothetical protein ACWELJ_02440 [Nocardia sp. NPDC004582]